MPVINNVIRDEVIEGKMYDLAYRFYREKGIDESKEDIRIEGYMQGNDGYFYLAKYRGAPIGSILHFKGRLVIAYFGSDKEGGEE